MAFLGRWEIDDLVTFPANTHAAATGAATDADSVPSYRVYEDETGTAILTGSMAKLDDTNTTGFYSEQITLSAANGFEVGKSYTIYVSATVNSVTGTMAHTFQVEAALATSSALATLQTSVDDLPTNAELATSQAAADDATLAAIAALNNLSAAQVNAEVDTALADVGLTTTITGRIDAAISTRASQASVDDVPTNAELATALAAADDAVLAAVATRASQTSVDTVDDLLDTELPALTNAVADLPTNAELATALGTADDATLAAIAALSIPDANTVADAVLSRGVSNVEDTADTTSLAALLLAAFESSVSGTTWTIRKTGGTTFVVKTVTVDAAADPITGIT